MNDGGGDIGNFGAGGLGAIDHTGKHLGGDDAEFGVGAAESDELALNNWDDFGAGLDGHVTTCNHDAIGGFDDFFEMFLGFNGFFGFDFRDHFGGGAEG